MLLRMYTLMGMVRGLSPSKTHRFYYPLLVGMFSDTFYLPSIRDDLPRDNIESHKSPANVEGVVKEHELASAIAQNATPQDLTGKVMKTQQHRPHHLVPAPFVVSEGLTHELPPCRVSYRQ